jgi:ABC-type sugar transport system permease subunit
MDLECGLWHPQLGILYALGLIDNCIPFLANPLSRKMSLIMAHIWKEGPLVAIFFRACG